MDEWTRYIHQRSDGWVIAIKVYYDNYPGLVQYWYAPMVVPGAAGREYGWRAPSLRDLPCPVYRTRTEAIVQAARIIEPVGGWLLCKCYLPLDEIESNIAAADAERAG